MKFNLSLKEHIHWGTEPAYAREDVREFVRLLLDNCCGVDCIRIKELAGAEITKPSEDRK